MRPPRAAHARRQPARRRFCVNAMRLSRRRFAAVAALAALAPVHRVVPARAAPAHVSVALDWYPNANHAGLFLGQARGYFAAADLDPELYTPADPSTVLQTVGAGRDDFGISYQTDVLLARAQNVPVVSVAALVQQPLMGIMSLKTAGIERPADLRGKTVAYPGIPSQEAFLTTMLEADGVTMADIALVNVGFDLVPAVVSGRAAAAMGAFWTHEPIVAEREGYPVNMMRVEDWGVPRYYELVIVASERRVADEPEEIRAFLGAMQRGYDAAAADQPAALDALAAASPDLDREVEEEGLRLVAPTWTEGGVPVGHQDPTRWADYAAWMVERELIPADLDVAAAYRADVLPETAPPATPGP
ncbi:MAG: ABC transporter substrate-binding protein [Thermomicrobiales bacterium]|nr:ABC transporter substrate-binding protein [Thermomicrobiales bacterium]